MSALLTGAAVGAAVGLLIVCTPVVADYYAHRRATRREQMRAARADAMNRHPATRHKAATLAAIENLGGQP